MTLLLIELQNGAAHIVGLYEEDEVSISTVVLAQISSSDSSLVVNLFYPRVYPLELAPWKNDRNRKGGEKQK